MCPYAKGILLSFFHFIVEYVMTRAGGLSFFVRPKEGLFSFVLLRKIRAKKDEKGTISIVGHFAVCT